MAHVGPCALLVKSVLQGFCIVFQKPAKSVCTVVNMGNETFFKSRLLNVSLKGRQIYTSILVAQKSPLIVLGCHDSKSHKTIPHARTTCLARRLWIPTVGNRMLGQVEVCVMCSPHSPQHPRETAGAQPLAKEGKRESHYGVQILMTPPPCSCLGEFATIYQ